MTTDTSATDRAQQAASTASEESKHVAGVAADEAKGVAADAKDQLRGLAGQTMGDVQGQVEDQSRQQKDRLAGTLATLGGDLGSMADGQSGLAAQLVGEVADRAQSLSAHLEEREPRELLDDVRRFARDRPGTFLLGALAAGVVVGRLARSTKDAAAADEAGLGQGQSAPPATAHRATPVVDPVVAPVPPVTPVATPAPMTPPAPIDRPFPAADAPVSPVPPSAAPYTGSAG